MSSESETKNRLTIIIPTVNNIKGVENLKNYFKNKEYQIIIVDNGLWIPACAGMTDCHLE